MLRRISVHPRHRRFVHRRHKSVGARRAICGFPRPCRNIALPHSGRPTCTIRRHLRTGAFGWPNGSGAGHGPTRFQTGPAPTRLRGCGRPWNGILRCDGRHVGFHGPPKLLPHPLCRVRQNFRWAHISCWKRPESAQNGSVWPRFGRRRGYFERSGHGCGGNY